MSSGGHPAVRYDTTVCCNSLQLRVKPMNRGVDTFTCGYGGVFHAGIGGMSEGDLAESATGKLSVIGGISVAAGGLYSGLGFSPGGVEGSTTGTRSMKPEWRSKILEMTMRGIKTRQMRRRREPWDSMVSLERENKQPISGV